MHEIMNRFWSFCRHYLAALLRPLKRKRVIKCNRSGKFPPPSCVSYGRDNRMSIGKGSTTFKTKAMYYGNSCQLIIGENCTVRNTTFWFEGTGGVIEIGDKTSIEGAHIAVVAANRIIIGADSMLSSGIYMATTDSHSIIDRSGKRINPDRDIEIGNHVWIGAGVQGVVVGSNSVVGACAVVTKSLPCNCIAAGVPARVIREGTDWLRERI